MLNGTTTGDIMFVLYDVAGAADSPFDKATTASGVQTGGGTLTTTSLTPSTANELVFNQTAIDFHTINGVIGKGFVLDSVVNGYDNDDPPTGGTDSSTLDEDNGYAHIYATTTGSEIFAYTYTQPGSGGVQNWGAVSAAFETSQAKSTPTPTPTPTPTATPTPVPTPTPTRSVTLAWDQNPVTSDPATNTVGYLLHIGFASGIYAQTTNLGNTTSVVVSNLTSGTKYFFAVTAYNSAGIDSPYSNEVSYSVP